MLARMVFMILFALAVYATSAGADCAVVDSFQKISDTEGEFSGVLDNSDHFGNGVATVPDLDNDGIDELAVGAIGDDDGAEAAGAVWILLMNADGKVKSHTKISNDNGGMPPGSFATGDAFGSCIATLGDVDGNGFSDLAVGAQFDNDGGSNRGAVWILFLGAGGNVDHFTKISDLSGNFAGVLDNDDAFGGSIAALGDLDGDDVVDIAVGANGDDDGAPETGAVWLLFLNSDGTVAADRKISATNGAGALNLDASDQFGTSVAGLGDLDGDSIVDLAVGAQGDDDGGPSTGAVWILFLTGNGTITRHQKISDTQGGFTGVLDITDQFGRGMATLGDLDGDGTIELAVNAQTDDDGGFDHGAVWILFMRRDGTVRYSKKISDTEGGFTGVLDDSDYFGTALSWLGDLNGDGIGDIAATAHYDDDGSTDRGAVWVLFLDSSVPPIERRDCAAVVQFDFALTNAGDVPAIDGFHLSRPRFPHEDSPGTPPDSMIALTGCGIADASEFQLPPSPPTSWCRVNEIPDDPGRRRQASWYFPSIAESDPAVAMSVAFSFPAGSSDAGSLLYEADYFLTSGADTVGCGIVQFRCDTLATSSAPSGGEVENQGPGVLRTRNFPNPFNTSTRIEYQLESRQQVVLEIFDAGGRRVRQLSSGVMEAGTHDIEWDGHDDRGVRAPAGVYFYTVETGRGSASKRIVVLK